MSINEGSTAETSNAVVIHNHYSPEGEKQRKQVADVIKACRADEWSDDAIASAVFVALLNPKP